MQPVEIEETESEEVKEIEFAEVMSKETEPVEIMSEEISVNQENSLTESIPESSENISDVYIPEEPGPLELSLEFGPFISDKLNVEVIQDDLVNLETVSQEDVVSPIDIYIPEEPGPCEIPELYVPQEPKPCELSQEFGPFPSDGEEETLVNSKSGIVENIYIPEEPGPCEIPELYIPQEPKPCELSREFGPFPSNEAIVSIIPEKNYFESLETPDEPSPCEVLDLYIIREPEPCRLSEEFGPFPSNEVEEIKENDLFAFDYLDVPSEPGPCEIPNLYIVEEPKPCELSKEFGPFPSSENVISDDKFKGVIDNENYEEEFDESQQNIQIENELNKQKTLEYEEEIRKTKEIYRGNRKLVNKVNLGKLELDNKVIVENNKCIYKGSRKLPYKTQGTSYNPVLAQELFTSEEEKIDFIPEEINNVKENNFSGNVYVSSYEDESEENPNTYEMEENITNEVIQKDVFIPSEEQKTSFDFSNIILAEDYSEDKKPEKLKKENIKVINGIEIDKEKLEERRKRAEERMKKSEQKRKKEAKEHNQSHNIKKESNLSNTDSKKKKGLFGFRK